MVSTINYYTDGPWGSGLLRRLHPNEMDDNFWQLEERLTAIETAPSGTVGISNIEVIGSQLKIFVSDGSSFGPFTLPTAMFRMRGNYTPGTPYAMLDLISVKQQGLFLVNIAHTSPGTTAVGDPTPFDPTLQDVNGNPYYIKVFGEDTYVYDVGFSYPGKPGQGITAGENFLEHIFDRDVTIAANFGVSKAKLGVPASSELVFPICKNDVQVGSLIFEPGESLGSFTWDVANVKTFVSTDVLGLRRPTNIDSTAKRLVVTFACGVV